MADHISINDGAAVPRNVGTDERSIGGNTVHVQRVSQSLGPEGTHTAPLSGRVVGAGTDGAAYVDPRKKMVRVQATPVISSTVTSGFPLSGLLTFANAARFSGGSVQLDSVEVADRGTLTLGLSLWLLDRAPSVTPVANSSWSPSDADLGTVVAVVPLTRHALATSSKAIHIASPQKSFPLLGTSLFGVLIATAGGSASTTGQITAVSLNLYQD